MVLFEVDEIVVIKGLRFRVRRWTRNGRLFLKRVGGGVKRDVVVSLDADADYASAIADAEYEAEQEAAMASMRLRCVMRSRRKRSIKRIRMLSIVMMGGD